MNCWRRNSIISRRRRPRQMKTAPAYPRFILIAVGSLVAALFGTQFFDPKSLFTPPSTSCSADSFILLTLLGTSTIMQLARLRAAWYESMLAMNQLKDYMMSENKALVKAFRWKTSTLPSKYKNEQCFLLSSCGGRLDQRIDAGRRNIFPARGLAFTLAVWQWIISASGGVLTIYFQLLLYKQISEIICHAIIKTQSPTAFQRLPEYQRDDEWIRAFLREAKVGHIASASRWTAVPEPKHVLVRRSRITRSSSIRMWRGESARISRTIRGSVLKRASWEKCFHPMSRWNSPFNSAA